MSVTILVFLAALVQRNTTMNQELKTTIQVTILVFLAALVQRIHQIIGRCSCTDPVTILVFLAALVQLKKRGSEQWVIYPLQSLFFWQL